MKTGCPRCGLPEVVREDGVCVYCSKFRGDRPPPDSAYLGPWPPNLLAWLKA